MTMELTFTKTLAKALEGRNISQVAREVGIPRNILFDWTKAKRAPSLHKIDYIKRLADYLGLTLDELLVGPTQHKKIISSVSFSDEGRNYRILVERI